jgi:DNA-binding LacI/PurR family transcriptional regulator
MKNIDTFPAIRQAVEFLSDNLEKGTWKPGERLPPVRYLARIAGVSPPSMCKAIAAFRKDEKISGLSRHRLRVGKSSENVFQHQEKLLQWQQKRMLLEKELLSGVLGHDGRLPQLKELQGRYNVSFGTIQKIVQAMVADGVIVPKGKGYALPSVQARSTKGRIVFVTIQGHASQRSALNSEHNRIVNAFESECVRRGLFFESIEVDFYDSRETRKVIAKLVDDEALLGFILDMWWYVSPNVQQAYIDVLSRLASLKKPVAILDEIGNFALPAPFTKNPLLQAYRIESKKAGERVARFLLGQGHRSVVFISLFEEAPWSRDRLDGIAGQFSRAGLGDGVHAVADAGGASLPIVLTVSGLSDADIRTFIAIGRTESQVADLEREWMNFKRTVKPPYTGCPRLNRAMREGLLGLIAMARKNPEKLFIEKTCAAALDAVERWLLPLHLHPCLEQALHITGATAWICANDLIAIGTLGFLRARKIGVPQDISVVGFDNIPVVALEEKLSTFDFNAQGFIHRMLNFIIRPLRPRGFYRHQVIEIEGIIMERETTGKVKSSDGRKSLLSSQKQSD